MTDQIQTPDQADPPAAPPNVTQADPPDYRSKLREKLAAARESFEDDSKNDHAALGHVLDILEESAGLDAPKESPQAS